MCDLITKEEFIPIFFHEKGRSKDMKIISWIDKSGFYEVIISDDSLHILARFSAGPGYPRYNYVDRNYLEKIEIIFTQLFAYTVVVTKNVLSYYEDSYLPIKHEEEVSWSREKYDGPFKPLHFMTINDQGSYVNE